MLRKFSWACDLAGIRASLHNLQDGFGATTSHDERDHSRIALCSVASPRFIWFWNSVVAGLERSLMFKIMQYNVVVASRGTR